MNSKLFKKTFKTNLIKVTKRNYFGNELPNYAALGIAEENRCDPWAGIDTSRANLIEQTNKFKVNFFFLNKKRITYNFYINNFFI